MANTEIKERVKRPACKPEDHDRFVYNRGKGDDEAPTAEDGLLGCLHCKEPAFYCKNEEWYFHVDVDGGECPPIHGIVQDGHPFLDPALDAEGVPVVAEQPE